MALLSKEGTHVPLEKFRSRANPGAASPQHVKFKAPDGLELKLEAELDLPPTFGQNLGDSRTSGTVNNSRGAASAA